MLGRMVGCRADLAAVTTLPGLRNRRRGAPDFLSYSLDVRFLGGERGGEVRAVSDPESWIGMYAELGYQQLDRYLAHHTAFEQ